MKELILTPEDGLLKNIKGSLKLLSNMEITGKWFRII